MRQEIKVMFSVSFPNWLVRNVLKVIIIQRTDPVQV